MENEDFFPTLLIVNIYEKFGLNVLIVTGEVSINNILLLYDDTPFDYQLPKTQCH
jgi:hypothetical protein